MDELFLTRCIVSENDVEETRAWTYFSNTSSKHQSNKCSVHEKQNIFSKREKYLAIEQYSPTKCQDLYELPTYFTDSLLAYGLLLMLK